MGHHHQLFSVVFTVAFDPVHCVMADSIQRTEYRIGLRKIGAQFRVTILAHAIMMDKTTIVLFNQVTKMAALAGATANEEDTATTEVHIWAKFIISNIVEAYSPAFQLISRNSGHKKKHVNKIILQYQQRKKNW